jgi:5'-nucleotidase
VKQFSTEDMNIYINKVARLAVVFSLFHLLAFSPLETGAKKHKQLVILHTNDTHSTIMPLNPNIDNRDLAGRGGFLRRVNMIKEQRNLHPGLLLIDSGDFSQGSGYYTLFKGEVEIGLMNQMGYDAVTIGNHEFDFGMENMAKLFRMADFPVVCSNYDCTGTVLEGLVKPYVTLMREGVKIGLFALAPPLKGLVFDGNCEGITYLDPAETAQKYIDILRKQEKCDLVICISHLGWEVSVYPDEKFLSLTDGCDLVLGGHTHTYMPELKYTPDKNGKMIPVDQNGKHGAFVGKLILNLEK